MTASPSKRWYAAEPVTRPCVLVVYRRLKRKVDFSPACIFYMDVYQLAERMQSGLIVVVNALGNTSGCLCGRYQADPSMIHVNRWCVSSLSWKRVYGPFYVSYYNCNEKPLTWFGDIYSHHKYKPSIRRLVPVQVCEWGIKTVPCSSSVTDPAGCIQRDRI